MHTDSTGGPRVGCLPHKLQKVLGKGSKWRNLACNVFPEQTQGRKQVGIDVCSQAHAGTRAYDEMNFAVQKTPNQKLVVTRMHFGGPKGHKKNPQGQNRYRKRRTAHTNKYNTAHNEE